MHKVLGLFLFSIACLAVAGTNTIPPLIIKGVVDPNAVPWSPSSSWWLRPATNQAHEAVAEMDVQTNKVAAPTSSSGETNIMKEAEAPAPSNVGANTENVTAFGASFGAARPIGQLNTGIGQQSLQLGKPAAGMGQPNTGIGFAKP